MVTGANLIALNEQDITIKAENKKASSQPVNYSISSFSPLNAISIYIKALEFINNKIDEVLSEYQEIEKFSKDIRKQHLIAEKRVVVYKLVERMTKVIQEFKQGFTIPEAHEGYEHFRYFYDRFVFIDERINLSYVLLKAEYVQEAKVVINNLIKVFSQIHAIIMTSEHKTQSEQKVEEGNDNNIAKIIAIIPETHLKASLNTGISV